MATKHGAPIRILRDDEPVPAGEPRRYIDGAGYVKLRWWTGEEFVETREHRLVAGRPEGKHVHHRNEDKADNRPENLEVIEPTAHARHHHPEVIDADRARAMYEAGQNTVQIGVALGVDSASVYRLLVRHGVQMRSLSEAKRVAVDDAELRRLHGNGDLRVPGIAKALGVGEGTVRRRMRELGLPSFSPGRPK